MSIRLRYIHKPNSQIMLEEVEKMYQYMDMFLTFIDQQLIRCLLGKPRGMGGGGGKLARNKEKVPYSELVAWGEGWPYAKTL